MIDSYDLLIDEVVTYRKQHGITQQQLAKSCGLTQSVIARMESKKATPKVDTLFRILSALDCSLALVPQNRSDASMEVETCHERKNESAARSL